MNTLTPEKCGIPSSAVKKYLEHLENAGLSTHSIIIARKENILFEKYYPPFTKDFLHREYSQSKSIVAMAVGIAAKEGLIDLDDQIGKYFPEETKNIKDPNMALQTIRQMLKMSTPKKSTFWFNDRCDDRVKNYFENTSVTAPLGSSFQYDSPGSFVLGAMVERITGMTLCEYLRPRLFDKIGVSKEIHCLKCPGGHSWGDSAFLATPRDMLKLCKFMLDGGKANGEQILDPQYAKEAVSNLIDTSIERTVKCTAQGYGYLIWKTYGEGFFFNGIGCQFSVAVPEKDLILIYNGDNQGIDNGYSLVIDGFFDIVVNAAGDELPEDNAEKEKLDEYAKDLKLMASRGNKYSQLEDKISGKRFVLNENPMGIKYMTLTFGDTCKLEYENAQGVKKFDFGRCENLFGLFPEEGYSREVGSVACPGNYYKTAFSGSWKDDSTLIIDVQAIDEYFGRLWITLHFENSKISVNMKKSAEDFFTTYQGCGEGNMQ